MLEVDDLARPGLGPISFTVAAGECLAVTGPSGAGKSLLLRAIADLDPNEGRVTLGEVDRASCAAPDWRRRVALVPAEAGWWADRVAEHFTGPPDASALDAVGLPAEAANWEVARLSTGERQRLALLRALAREPKALLLDEPTSGLDADATARVEALLREHMAAGVPIVMVTHDSAQAARLATRGLRIEGGQAREVTP